MRPLARSQGGAELVKKSNTVARASLGVSSKARGRTTGGGDLGYVPTCWGSP